MYVFNTETCQRFQDKKHQDYESEEDLIDTDLVSTQLRESDKCSLRQIYQINNYTRDNGHST